LPGTRFAGPAIVEQSDSTLLVPPGRSVRADASGNLLVHAGES
jgi:N-methylhydantoinase A